MHGFKAKLVATEGLLVSGVRQQVSPAFESQVTARDWAKANIKANIKDGRKVKFAGFLEVNFVDITDTEIEGQVFSSISPFNH